MQGLACQRLTGKFMKRSRYLALMVEAGEDSIRKDCMRISDLNRKAHPTQAESQPVSRVLSRAAIPLGPTSPSASSGLPGSTRGRTLRPLAEPRLPYLALLQVGFAMPSDVAIDAVRSYRTVSPLPALFPALRRFTFCCTVRELALPRRYLAPCPLSPDFPPRRLAVTQRLPG
jgi:hypothetical protein